MGRLHQANPRSWNHVFAFGSSPCALPSPRQTSCPPSVVPKHRPRPDVILHRTPSPARVYTWPSLPLLPSKLAWMCPQDLAGAPNGYPRPSLLKRWGYIHILPLIPNAWFTKDLHDNVLIQTGVQGYWQDGEKTFRIGGMNIFCD